MYSRKPCPSPGGLLCSCSCRTTVTFWGQRGPENAPSAGCGAGRAKTTGGLSLQWEALPLSQDELPSIHLSGETVSRLKEELLSQTAPPGEHLSTAIILRSFMKDRAVFAEGVPFQDEEIFARCMEEDEVLLKAYWAVRLALAHGEFDAAARLKLWLKAGPGLFEGQDPRPRVWFSLQDFPCEADIRR